MLDSFLPLEENSVSSCSDFGLDPLILLLALDNLLLTSRGADVGNCYVQLLLNDSAVDLHMK